MVKVSVCIQTYNHKPFIAQALDSVLMQETDFDYEIILGEDESEDGTREICIDYANRYPDRIRLFLRSRKDVININGKPSGRFNLIENLKAAQGVFIALLDGDDYWIDPLKLQKQVVFLENHPDFSFCFHDIYKLYDNGITEKNIYRFKLKVFTLNHLLKENFIATCSVLFRNGLLSELPSWYLSLSMGDWPLYILLAESGKFGFLDEIMACYRISQSGTWSQTDGIENLNNVIQMYKCIKTQLGKRYNLMINSQISKNYFAIAAQYSYRSHEEKAKVYLRKSFFTSPINPYIHVIDIIALIFKLYLPGVHTQLLSFINTLHLPLQRKKRSHKF